MSIPFDVINILDRLKKCGIKAYVVGGAVRDMLLGKEPDDYDVAAECLPGELIEAFEGFRCVDNGIRFGTLTVVGEGRNVEITCCRREGGYTDLRRPDTVEFCKNIEEDLGRRDFTVNAIAMAADGTVIDPYGGEDDIRQGSIRCVGDPKARFCEDALRLIRALRFSSCLGFEIEENTKKAIHECRALLTNVSGERIMAELEKLITGKNVLSVLLDYSDVICTLIPELSPCVGFQQKNPHHIYTVYEHIARSVDSAPPDVCIRLCMLLHDVAKPQCFFIDNKGIGHFYGHPEVSASVAQDILKRLKADGNTVKKVCFLVRYHDLRPAATRKSIRKYLTKVGFEGARELLSVRRADLSAQSPQFFSQFDCLDESEKIIEELYCEGACISVRDLAVNGNDLIEVGIPKGRAVGEMLAFLLSEVVAERLKNEREALLRAVVRKKK